MTWKFSRRKWIWTGAVVFVTVVLVLQLRDWESGKSRYEGRTAEEWIELFFDKRDVSDKKAERAFDQLGDSAVEGLIEKMHDKGGMRTTPQYVKLYMFLFKRWKEVPLPKPYDVDGRNAVAADMLGKIKATNAIPALCETFLGLKGRETRWRAMRAIQEMGPLAEGAVPAVVKALHDDSNEDIRSLAAITLAKIVHDAEVAVPYLIAALQDDAYIVRIWSVKALGELGPSAKDAVDEIESIETNEEQFRSVIRKALESINSDPGHHVTQEPATG